MEKVKNYYAARDKAYAESLGYRTDINYDGANEQLEYEMTHLFDYEQKTQEYLDSLY